MCMREVDTHTHTPIVIQIDVYIFAQHTQKKRPTHTSAPAATPGIGNCFSIGGAAYD